MWTCNQAWASDLICNGLSLWKMKCIDYEPVCNGHVNSTCWVEDNLASVNCFTIYFSMQCCLFYWSSKIRNMSDKITWITYCILQIIHIGKALRFSWIDQQLQIFQWNTSNTLVQWGLVTQDYYVTTNVSRKLQFIATTMKFFHLIYTVVLYLSI